MGREMISELDSILNEYQPGEIIKLNRVSNLLELFQPLKHYFVFPKRKDLLRIGI